MEVKWIKIVTNIFDDEKVRYIESLPNGDESVVIWFRILCLAGKSNSGGLLMMTDRIAYTDEMLASIFQRDIMSIRLALKIFEDLEMIERFDNKIYLTNWKKHQSLDALEKKKIYDKEYQKKKRNEKLIVNKSYDNRTTIVENRITDIELELDKDIDKEKDIRIKNRANKFAKPTLEEIKSYCVERKNKVNPENFMNHYDSNGWKVGKNPMKDWRAAVRTWERNQFSNKEIPELPEYYNRIEEEIDKTELLKKLKEM